MTAGIKANSDGSAAIQVGGTDVITLTSGGAATFVTSPTTLAGDLTFTGTGNRITGDFSTNTIANRVAFQTSTVNGISVVSVIPNGTGTATAFHAFNNSDPTNAARAVLQVSNAEVVVSSGITGTGTYLPMTFYTGGSESMRLSATSKALILSGGDTTANGTGITFPATQSASSNANTLDDYEEGTWTPAIRGSGTAGTYQNGGGTAGAYTKVGNLVTIICNIQLTTITGGGTGYLQITGIPFSNSETAQGAVQMQGLDMTTNYTWLTAMPITTGTTTWYLSESGDNQAGNDFPISGVSSNDVIRFTATYRAA